MKSNVGLLSLQISEHTLLVLLHLSVLLRFLHYILGNFFLASVVLTNEGSAAANYVCGISVSTKGTVKEIGFRERRRRATRHGQHRASYNTADPLMPRLRAFEDTNLLTIFAAHLALLLIIAVGGGRKD